MASHSSYWGGEWEAHPRSEGHSINFTWYDEQTVILPEEETNHWEPSEYKGQSIGNVHIDEAALSGHCDLECAAVETGDATLSGQCDPECAKSSPPDASEDHGDPETKTQRKANLY